MSDAARLKATVFVAGLDEAVNDQVLAAAFLPFGEIVDITIPKPEIPSSTDPHRGFGYVEFELQVDAQEAIDNMDQSELFGRVIKVAQAKPQRDSNEGLGSKQAIWTQEGYLAKHAIKEEDKSAIGQGDEGIDRFQQDPMEDLEGIDLAGPKTAGT